MKKDKLIYKDFIKIIIYGFFIITTTSCNQSMLDVPTTTSYNPNAVFTNTTLAQNYVYDLYSGLRGLTSPGTGGYEALTDVATYQPWGFEAIPGFKSYLTGGITADNVNDLISGFAPENSWTQGTPNIWTYNYKTIQKCNNFLANIANTKASPAGVTQSQIDKMSAEARFIRAWLYLDLAKMFGGVPLVTKTYTITEASYQVPRSSFDDVITFVTTECDAVAKLLNGSGNASVVTGQVSSMAAYGLKARALLYAASALNNTSNDVAKWTAAETATQVVLDSAAKYKVSLAAKDVDVFKTPVSSEVFFCRTFSSTYNVNNFLPLGLNANNPYGYFGLNYDYWPSGADGQERIIPTQKFVNMFQTISGKYPYQSDDITPNVAATDFDPNKPFVNRDPRLAKIIMYPGSGPWNFKPNGTDNRYRYYEYWDSLPGNVNPNASNQDKNSAAGGIYTYGRDSKTAAQLGKNPYAFTLQTGYLFLKYMDFTVERAPGTAKGRQIQVFLRLTEFMLNMAEIKIAKGQEGAALTLLNQIRSRSGMTAALASSGAQLVTDYRNERAIELNLEDHRFFDLMRWKAANGTVNAPVLGLTDVKMDWTGVAKVAKIDENIAAIPMGTLKFGNPAAAVNAPQRTIVWNDKFYRFPIPNDEIKRSNNALVQNSGY